MDGRGNLGPITFGGYRPGASSRGQYASILFRGANARRNATGENRQVNADGTHLITDNELFWIGPAGLRGNAPSHVWIGGRVDRRNGDAEVTT